jgi:hypothetical protein
VRRADLDAQRREVPRVARRRRVLDEDGVATGTIVEGLR